MSTDKKTHTDHPSEKSMNDDELLSQEALDAEDDAIGLPDEDAQAEPSEAQQLRDQLLRAHAQMDNIKRRAENDVAKAHKFGVEKLLKELLPILDSLEHALDASNRIENTEAESFKAMHDGLALTHKMFLSTLHKFAVHEIHPLHQAFDPNLHEAMTMVATKEHKPNTVMTVVQKGYKLHDRVIRPARVVVAKEV